MASQLPASQFLFSTPAVAVNPSGGLPVAVAALFALSGEGLQVTVANTEADLKSDSQALAEMTFQVSESFTSPIMTSASEIATVASDGTFTTTTKAGSKPHIPFLWESADSTITSDALTLNDKIGNVVFYFGTTAGQGSVDAMEGADVPEPPTIPLSAGGALLLSLIAWRRRRSP
jgi:hypothetical protein